MVYINIVNIENPTINITYYNAVRFLLASMSLFLATRNFCYEVKRVKIVLETEGARIGYIKYWYHLTYEENLIYWNGVFPLTEFSRFSRRQQMKAQR